MCVNWRSNYNHLHFLESLALPHPHGRRSLLIALRWAPPRSLLLPFLCPLYPNLLCPCFSPCRRLTGSLCCWCSAPTCWQACLSAWDLRSRSTSITSKCCSSVTLRRTRETPSWAEANGHSLQRWGRDGGDSAGRYCLSHFSLPLPPCKRDISRAWEWQELWLDIVRGGGQKWWARLCGFCILIAQREEEREGQGGRTAKPLPSPILCVL